MIFAQVGEVLNITSQPQTKTGLMSFRPAGVAGVGAATGVASRVPMLTAFRAVQYRGATSGPMSGGIKHTELDNQLAYPVQRGQAVAVSGDSGVSLANVTAMLSPMADTPPTLSTTYAVVAAGKTLVIDVANDKTIVGGQASASYLYAVVSSAAAGTIKFESSADGGTTWFDRGTFDLATETNGGNAYCLASTSSTGSSTIVHTNLRYTIVAGASSINLVTVGAIANGRRDNINLLSRAGGVIYGEVQLSNIAGVEKKLAMQTLGVTRWRKGQGTADAFEIDRHNSSGTKLDTPLSIAAATGLATLTNGLAVTGGTVQLPTYTVATLPSAAVAGQLAYASNGRVGLELEAAGTGTPVFSKGGVWMKYDNTAVAA